MQTKKRPTGLRYGLFSSTAWSVVSFFDQRPKHLDAQTSLPVMSKQHRNPHKNYPL